MAIHMSRQRVKVFIGIGSNLDNPIEHVLLALNDIEKIADTQLLNQSSLYRSAPIGPPDQPHYINAVAVVQTQLTAIQLLMELQTIENKHGRKRTDIRWQARTLDLDLLIYGESIINEQSLKVPHPQISKRNFVLYPLHELEPSLTIPTQGQVSKLLQQCDQGDIIKLELV